MKNMKIGKRLIISFIIVSLIASIAGVVGLVVTLNTDANYSEALVTNGFSQGDIGEFNTAINKGAALVRDIIFLTDGNELQTARTELETVSAKTQDALASLKETCGTPSELEQIRIIDENLPKYLQSRARVVDLGLANQNNEALELFRTEARPLLNKCTDAAQALADMNETMGYEVSEKLTLQSKASVVVILVVVITALVISILLGIFISHSVSRPITACSERLNQLAKGDLHSPVPAATSRDEAGQMLTSLDTTVTGLQTIIQDIDYGLSELAKGNLRAESKMEYVGDYVAIKKSIGDIIDSLNTTMGEINRSADQVAGGADQVSGGAQALSQGATEQASSVEELAATISEISQQVQQNAQSARQASDRANNVGAEAADSNQKMQDMLAAMDDISNTSNEIGKIIKTIEDIAFQTNILALNAAVEAARAGAAGKGFAVVADEVRNLASKSGEASKNTASLIEGSLRAVESGTKIAGETAASLNNVIGGVQEVITTIDQISAASSEQAQSISQVTQGVDQISSVVQTNSATAEESAAASEELSSQAQVLKTLVGRFQLREGAPQLGSPELAAQNIAPFIPSSSTQALSSATDY